MFQNVIYPTSAIDIDCMTFGLKASNRLLEISMTAVVTEHSAFNSNMIPVYSSLNWLNTLTPDFVDENELLQILPEVRDAVKYPSFFIQPAFAVQCHKALFCGLSNEANK